MHLCSLRFAMADGELATRLESGWAWHWLPSQVRRVGHASYAMMQMKTKHQATVPSDGMLPGGLIATWVLCDRRRANVATTQPRSCLAQYLGRRRSQAWQPREPCKAGRATYRHSLEPAASAPMLVRAYVPTTRTPYLPTHPTYLVWRRTEDPEPPLSSNCTALLCSSHRLCSPKVAPSTAMFTLLALLQHS